jgi:hypothetical protein
MAEPPVDEGALQVRATVVLPGVALKPVGAPATVTGVADASLEAAEDPAAFTAFTVK